MLAGSNPAARTRQSQSPRSPYRGAGRLFSIWFAGLTTFCRCFMICSSSLSTLPAYPIAICGSPPHQSPRLPYRFSVPPHRIALFDPPCRTTIRFSGTRRPPPFSPRSLSDGRGGSVPPPLHASLSVQSASRLPPRLAFRWAARCLCLSALLYGRRGECVFFARISVFPVDSATVCDTLIDIHAGVVERQTRQI